MELIDGNKIAADIIAELKAEVATLKGDARMATLLVRARGTAWARLGAEV